MTLKMLTMSAATAALLATGALAQTATPPVEQAPAEKAPAATTATTTTTSTTTEAIQYTSTVSGDQMLVSSLTGLAVRNAAGENLGDINDIIIDKSGKPAVAVIGVGGFLGIGEKDVGIPFEAISFTTNNDSKERIARLDVTKEALKAAPAFVYADSTQVNTAPVVRTQ